MLNNEDYRMKDRISKQELMEMYQVDRSTIENWKKNHNLPLIEINSHSKFVRRDELIEWENKQTMKRDTQK
jgi:hypothetical protein